MKYLAIFLILLHFSCSSSEMAKKDLSSPQVINIFPGAVRWVQFEISKNEIGGKLKCSSDEIKTKVSVGDKKVLVHAFIIESYFSALAKSQCVWSKDNSQRIIAEVKVEAYKFPQEVLRVQPRKLVLKKKDLQRVQKEQMELNLLYGNSASDLYFNQPFQVPLDSHITSIYGTKRLYNNHHNGQHLGTDFRAAIGVPIPASNRGKVMLAKDLFYTGYTVIIDHGLDIFTVYAHLSKTSVKRGDMVEQGTIIGLSGNTGRTSGPHLHWGIKIHRQWIDGFSLIDESRKYVESIQ